MSRPNPLEVVSKVIDQASQKRGWSLAQLTRRLGKGDNTLFRWRSGKTTSMDIRSIVQLFELAEISMDDAFGLDVGDGTDSSLSESRYDELRSELDEIKDKLAMVEPVAVLLKSVGSSLLASQMADSVNDDEREFRSNVKSNTALRKSLKKAKSMGGGSSKSAKKKTGKTLKRA